ncbi:hypothetical protein R3I94_014050 [Phoxinus phoxinus]
MRPLLSCLLRNVENINTVIFLGFREPSFFHHLAFGSQLVFSFCQGSKRKVTSNLFRPLTHTLLSVLCQYESVRRSVFEEMFEVSFLTKTCVISKSFSGGAVPLESSLWKYNESGQHCNFN